MLQMMQGWDDEFGVTEPGFVYPERGYSSQPSTRGGHAAALGSQYFEKRFAVDTPRPVMIVGSAVRVPTGGGYEPGQVGYTFMALVAEGGPYGYQGIELFFADGSDNRLWVRTSATQSGFPTEFTLARDTWFYAELKGKLAADATGFFEARINGTTVLRVENLVTSSSGISEAITHGLFGYTGPVTHFDDSYMADITGSECNDFLGDVHVATLRPTGPGDSAQFTSSDGSPNWDAANGATGLNLFTSVSPTAPGQDDLYAVADLSTPSATTEILAVQTVGVVKRPGASDLDVGLLTRAGGVTKYEGAAAAPVLTVVPYSSIPADTTNTGGAPTVVSDADAAYSTTSALQPADLGDSSFAEFTFTFDLAAPKAVAFRYRVSSEGSYDFGSILLDDVQLFRLSGETGWATSSVTALEAGAHTVVVRYTKDSSASSGFDNIHLGSMLVGDTPADFGTTTVVTTEAFRIGALQLSDPAGNPWSPAAVNAMQIGARSV